MGGQDCAPQRPCPAITSCGGAKTTEEGRLFSDKNGVILIDGHLALRTLLQDIEEAETSSEEGGETEAEDREYDV